ncbi:hypothetical protein ON010_g307 [Phytophthora cinnamomi]|nr:hypothetical protein ON010_g307 [Phytophthora cinnamomi]
MISRLAGIFTATKTGNGWRCSLSQLLAGGIGVVAGNLATAKPYPIVVVEKAGGAVAILQHVHRDGRVAQYGRVVHCVVGSLGETRGVALVRLVLLKQHLEDLRPAASAGDLHGVFALGVRPVRRDAALQQKQRAGRSVVLGCDVEQAATKLTSSTQRTEKTGKHSMFRARRSPLDDSASAVEERRYPDRVDQTGAVVRQRVDDVGEAVLAGDVHGAAALLIQHAGVRAEELDVVELVHVEAVALGVVAHEVLVAHELEVAGGGGRHGRRLVAVVGGVASAEEVWKWAGPPAAAYAAQSVEVKRHVEVRSPHGRAVWAGNQIMDVHM